MAGWLLGRDELIKAQKTADGVASIRKILLLTDGNLNAGITEPDLVEALTRAGLEKDEIRTSCPGFGDGYNENILAAMSKVGQGQLHDADSREKFPIILADELVGLQKLWFKICSSGSNQNSSATPGNNMAITLRFDCPTNELSSHSVIW
jgi:Ca-activated chloride channel family protein